jgi:hypothetical protein
MYEASGTSTSTVPFGPAPGALTVSPSTTSESAPSVAAGTPKCHPFPLRKRSSS